MAAYSARGGRKRRREDKDMDSAIRTVGLTKHFGTVRALQDLTLDVRQGEIQGFLGPNGAGKTTAIRLLLGYLHPTAGEASIFGLDCRSDYRKVRERLGYLPSEPGLYDSLSGQEYLDYMARYRAKDVRARQRYLVEALELEDALRRKVKGYSRGMKQKLGLVQVLQAQPDLVILDEPTTGLDPLMQLRLYDLLREERDAGRTVFFSSHNLPEVERLCDRAAILREGRLMAVEQVQGLRKVRVRVLHVTFSGPVPTDGALPGADVMERGGNTAVYSLSGDMDSFLKALARYQVEDLTSEEPSLEEVFLKFYRGEEGQ
jgi:ABC-2 type transport system ATP-binding protein